MRSDNEWMEEIQNSLDGMQRATMSKQLSDKIVQQLSVACSRVVRIPRMMVWTIAAGVALLIALNISTLFRQKSTENLVQMRQANPLSDYFQSPPSI